MSEGSWTTLLLTVGTRVPVGTLPVIKITCPENTLHDSTFLLSLYRGQTLQWYISHFSLSTYFSTTVILLLHILSHGSSPVSPRPGLVGYSVPTSTPNSVSGRPSHPSRLPSGRMTSPLAYRTGFRVLVLDSRSLSFYDLFLTLRPVPSPTPSTMSFSPSVRSCPLPGPLPRPPVHPCTPCVGRL